MITFELALPPRELSPNVRTHPWNLIRHKRIYRHACKVDSLNVRRGYETVMTFPLPPPVQMHLTFVVTTKRRRDLDNLIASMKSGIDGIVDAGLIRDDSADDLSITADVELGEGPCVGVTPLSPPPHQEAF